MKRGESRPAEAQGKWLADRLRDSDVATAYLNASLAEGNQAAFRLALHNPAKGVWCGMAATAVPKRATAVLISLTKVLDALGFSLMVAPKKKSNLRSLARRLPKR